MMNILFICTGNTCRSPMASALTLKSWQAKRGRPAAKDFQVSSAGLFTADGFPASPQAVEVMREHGIDISQHRSARLRDWFIQDATLILTMTVSQRDYLQDRFSDQLENIYTLGEFVGVGDGEILDPYGQDVETYRKTRYQLSWLVEMLVNKII